MNGDPSSGGVVEDSVVILSCDGFCLFNGLAKGYRKEFDRIIGSTSNLLQFAFDTVFFPLSILFSLDSSPAPPAGGFSAAGCFVHQDRLDPKRFSNRPDVFGIRLGHRFEDEGAKGDGPSSHAHCS